MEFALYDTVRRFAPGIAAGRHFAAQPAIEPPDSQADDRGQDRDYAAEYDERNEAYDERRRDNERADNHDEDIRDRITGR